MTEPTQRDPDSVPWTEVSGLLDRLLETPTEKRDAILTESCAHEPGLADRLRKMLQSAEGSSFLDGDAAGFAGPAWAEESIPGGLFSIGGRIGPYRIVKRLAFGGMSVVYIIERDDGQFDRTAVLKVLDHVGSDPEEAVRRFEAERQILATMNHPNIASVYDGGVTSDGRPYLVLEYVPGQTITDYCTARKLPIVARLRLFETVCRAVQHAHRLFVVHRDLKPGNILVREDGTVKLLDFGIAKILDAGDRGAAPVTRTELRLLTPEYAAPEQIRGEAITSATDVYALGVLLYELITGRRPYTLTGRTPAAIEKTICHEDPERPSVAVGKGGGPAGPAASSVSRQLRGDLDVITLTALRKEPEARYASPQDLADDVSRHLQNLPVAARSTSFVYRTRRLLWRNRIVAAAVVAAVAFGAFHLVQITRERNLAQREAAKAEQVAAFLRDLFEVSDPDVAQGRTVSARDLLDRAAGRIQTELAGQPEVRADMLMVLADIYTRLSLYGEAAPLVSDALAIHREQKGPHSSEAAGSLELLGDCELELGHYENADRYLEESLNIRLERFGPDHAAVGSSMQLLGVSALNQNRYDRADSLFTKALRIRRALSPEADRDLATTLKDLGMVRTAQGDYVGAETLLREGLAIRRRVLGDSHSDVYIAMTNLGDNLSLQGRFDEAVPLLTEGTDGLERILGNAHAEVAEGLNVLGITYFHSGRYHQAEAAIRRAVDIRRNINGERHPDYARGLNDLGAMFIFRDDYASAEPLLRRSLEINREVQSDDHMIVVNHTNLARALGGLERYDEALEHFAAAEAGHIRNFGESHIRPAHVRLARTMMIHRRGDRSAAEEGYRSLLEPFRAAYPDGGWRLASLYLAFGQMLVETDRPEEALPYLEDGERQMSAARGDESMPTAKARIALAEGLAALGRYESAEPFLRAGLAVEEQFLPPDHYLMRRAWQTALSIYEGLNRPGDADRYRDRLNVVNG